MRRTVPLAALVLTALSLTACSAAVQQPASRGPVPLSPAEVARADSGRPPYTSMDAKFMQGMIGHHAQAVWMARLAASHRARADVRILAERIDVSQRDEIAFMERWLRERHETVPDAAVSSGMAGHDMGGMSMPGMLMPGMLTHDQMMELDAATGPAFDRLFLTGMIQHHRGALTMVDQLFSTRGAGQENTVFRFASDVSADQSTEIDRMLSMIAAMR